MHTSTSWEHEHELAESEVFWECSGEHIFGHQHKFPTVHTSLLACAAGSHVVIVVHVKIEYKLSLHWTELFVILRGRAWPHCTRVHFARGLFINRSHPGLELLRGSKFHIPLHALIGILEGKLPVLKRDLVVVGEPVVERGVGIQMLVVVPQVIRLHAYFGGKININNPVNVLCPLDYYIILFYILWAFWMHHCWLINKIVMAWWLICLIL